jgi:hypothetical protein
VGPSASRSAQPSLLHQAEARRRGRGYSHRRIFMRHHKMWTSWHAACGSVEAILAVLAGRLCTILHPNFGGLSFHALR